MTRPLETTLNTPAQERIRGRRAGPWLAGGFVWGIGVWLLEGVLNLTHQSPTATELLASGRTTLFFYELAGMTIAGVLGLVWAGLFGERTAKAWLELVRLRWRELRLAPTEVRRDTIASMYAGVGVTLGCLWVVFHAARDVSLRIGDRDNLALCIVGIQLAALVVALAAYRVAKRGFGRAQSWLGGRFQGPGLAGHFCVVLGLCLGLLALVVAGFWPPFAELLRRYGLPGALGLGVAAASARIAPRLGPRGWRLTSAGTVLMLAASGMTGVLVHEANGAHWAAAPCARLALGWGQLWLDWDRDAHLTGFGDNDCAPLDASIHPGALDLPGNRRDEDCDGADARVETTRVPEPVASQAWHTTSAGAVAALGASRPNLYLITIDALATWTLEPYGGAPSIAPKLSDFAKQSVVFENFFVQGPSTRLSFPALFTSRFDTQIDQVLQGRFPFELAPSNRTLAEVLADAGYDTFAVIPSPYFLPQNWRGLLQGFQNVATRPAEAYANGAAHTASAVTAAALELLRLPRQKPVFFWAHYFDAHPPHVWPEGEQARGGGEAATYAAEVTHLDRHVGELIDAIVAHDPNHVIVLTSDHGMAFDEPRHQRDHYGYDLSTLVLHVPFMLRAKALAPRHISSLAGALDLAPTLTQLAGVPAPESFMGRSLAPLLSGKASNLPEALFAQFYLGEEALRGRDPLVMVAARTLEHNLVFDRRTGTLTAFRWRADPEERHDRWPDVVTAPPDGRANASHDLHASSPAGAGADEIAELRELKRTLDAHLYEVVAPSTHSHRSHNETGAK